MKKGSSPQSRGCANAHCQRRDIRARGRCQACYVFVRRHGRDATPDEMRSLRRRQEQSCQNCGERPIRVRGRCQRCYQFFMRTGRERPAAHALLHDGMCVVCGRRPPYRQGRCRSCYGYRSLHRKDRTENV